MATKINLPTSQGGAPIQVLSPGAVSTISVAVASARDTIPSGAQPGDILRVACTTDCYFKFGSSTVTASSADALFTSGVEYLTIPNSATHLAAIRVGTDGVLTMSLMN